MGVKKRDTPVEGEAEVGAVVQVPLKYGGTTKVDYANLNFVAVELVKGRGIVPPKYRHIYKKRST